MNLPYIAVEGIGKNREEILRSLIEIEPVLVMLGYDKKDEAYNNCIVICYGIKNTSITEMGLTHILTSKTKLAYYSHNGADFPKRFRSTEILRLINYVEQFKNK